MLLRMGIRAVATAAGTMFVGVIGVLMGISNTQITTAVAMRSVLVVALVLVLTRAFRIRDRGAPDAAARRQFEVLVAAGLAYFINPASWGGHTLFGQSLVSPGVLSAVIDLILWMAVAAVGVLLAERLQVKASSEPVPYA